MDRVGKLLAAALLAAGLAGCCAGPERFYQNAYGFNNPEIDCYRPGPRPPITTPPGFSSPAMEEPISTDITAPGV